MRAGGTRLGKFGFDIRKFSGEGGIDNAVERFRRSVGNDAEHVVERDTVAAGDIQEKLLDLAACGAAVAAKQLRAMIEQAIAGLPPSFRMVFILREIEGMSVEETGEALGVAPATVNESQIMVSCPPWRRDEAHSSISSRAAAVGLCDSLHESVSPAWRFRMAGSSGFEIFITR